MALSTVQFAVAAIVSGIGAALTETPTLAGITECIWPLLYVGIMSGGVGYTLQILAQKDANPTVVSLLLSLESVFSVLAGALILHDRLTGRELLGCALMLLAVVLAQLPARGQGCGSRQRTDIIEEERKGGSAPFIIFKEVFTVTKIFVGFLFVFLNFNFTLNDTYVINLLPDFVGFILLYMGTRELLEESPRYTTAGPWLLGLTAYGIASWVINLLGLNGGWVISLLTLVAAAVTYYATWLVIKGFEDIEKNNSAGIAAAESMRSWKICAILNIVAVALSWVPVLSVLLLLGMVVVTIMLLVSLNKTRKLYNAYRMLRPQSNNGGPEF